MGGFFILDQDKPTFEQIEASILDTIPISRRDHKCKRIGIWI